MLWLAINLIHLLLRCGLRLLTEEICQISDWGRPNSPKHLRGNLAAVQVSFTHDNLLFLSAFLICRPTRTRTQTNSFGDCYATITPSTYFLFAERLGSDPNPVNRTICLAGSPVSLTVALSIWADKGNRTLIPSMANWCTSRCAISAKNVGCNIGFEPMTFWTTIRRSNQLN